MAHHEKASGDTLINKTAIQKGRTQHQVEDQASGIRLIQSVLCHFATLLGNRTGPQPGSRGYPKPFALLRSP
jgi:hypothetical protein